MLKGKLKIPEKALKVFPDRLGSLVKGFDDHRDAGGGDGLETASFDLGEELETFHPNGFVSDREESDADKKMAEEELEVKVRPKPDKEVGLTPDSKHVIEVDEKRSDLEYELSQDEINLEKLQRIASTGIPDGGTLRATTWKLLLGYLPPSRDLWDKVLTENRQKYVELKEELLSTPTQSSGREEGSSSMKKDNNDPGGPLLRHDVSNEDHPLCLGEASVWHKFFEYTEIAHQIDRDLQRTHPEMKYFSADTPQGKRTKDEKEENAEIQYVKFEVQKSETMEGFVHIRSCYNNKFWVRKSGDEGSEWIAVEANEEEEDPSKGSCTLFKAVLVDGAVDGGDVEEHKDHTDGAVDGGDVELEHKDHTSTMEPQKIRLVHVDQLGKQGCVTLAGSDLLVLGDVDSRADDGVFLAYNAASVIWLPDRVAFMGHTDEYAALTTVYIHALGHEITFMEFRTRDIGDAGVDHEIMQWPLSNVPIIVINTSTSRGWVESGNFIVLARPVGDIYIRLIPIPLGGNNIAFITGARFANCGSIFGMAHVLGRSATSITQQAIFRLAEPVLYRSISNVVFNLADARVYNVGPVEKFRDERRNDTSVEQIGAFSVEYTVTETKTWSDSVSVTTGISASMSASVPFVGVSLGVELSTERNHTVTFGTEVSESRTVSFEQGIIIPPGKKVTMLVVATRAQCDVPFRSNVVDIMTNGTRREYTKTDGLFQGANEFSFRTEMSEEDL